MIPKRKRRAINVNLAGLRQVQSSLDVAIIKQALVDLRQPAPTLCRTELPGSKLAQVLEAAEWFLNGRPSHLYSFPAICERLGLDWQTSAARILANLPDHRLDLLKAKGVISDV